MPNELGPVKQAIVKQTADIDGFLAKRNEFIKKVSAICVEGKDYHVIQGKKSLAKGGAEKIASIFQWNATFVKDTESLEMLGLKEGLVAFKCTLSKGSKFVGEGRGAATVAKNGGDPNKTLKMAQKSAFIDAVLRASGLSDFFTQDLEDMRSEDIQQKTDDYDTSERKVHTASPKQKKFIADLMEQKGYTLEDLADNGLIAGKTSPTEVIDFLKEAKSKLSPNGTEVPNLGKNPWEKWKKPAQEEVIDLNSPEVRTIKG